MYIHLDDPTPPPATEAHLAFVIRRGRSRRLRSSAAGAVAVVAVGAVGFTALKEAPDRISTVPATPAAIPFCEGAREAETRRAYAEAVELVHAGARRGTALARLYLPDPVPSGACVSNVEAAVLFSLPAVTNAVTVWFEWDGARISLYQSPSESPHRAIRPQQVLIAGESWDRRDTPNGSISLSRRFDDGTVVTLSTSVQAEDRARRIAALLSPSDASRPSHDARQSSPPTSPSASVSPSVAPTQPTPSTAPSTATPPAPRRGARLEIVASPQEFTAGQGGRLTIRMHAPNGGMLESWRVDLGDKTSRGATSSISCTGKRTDPRSEPPRDHVVTVNHTYSRPGSYTIRATVRTGGCGVYPDTATGSLVLHVRPAPSPSAQSSPASAEPSPSASAM